MKGMKKQFFFLFVFAMFAVFVFAESLTTIEKQIAETAKSSAEEATAFLEKVVNINSGTMNHEGVTEVGRIFAKEFEDAWF